MKLVYVAALTTTPDRDSGWIREFADLGWQVVPVSSHCVTTAGLLGSLQRRLNIGTENRRMQQSLLDCVRRERPRWVHFRLPIEIDLKTILQIKSMGSLVTQYFNDDPFSSKQPWGLNWKFKRALTAYDGHFVYRRHNIDAYLRAGAAHVEHCAPTYDPARHKPCRVEPCLEFLADAAFIGHCEGDQRVAYLEAIQDAGFSLIIRGGGWDGMIADTRLAPLRPVTHAFGAEYNEIYGNVRAGLCFFSKINRDSWTERALEIIAVGGLLVCERTEEGMSYFKDRSEAFFFSSSEELIDIVRELKDNPQLREMVREKGHQRLLGGQHTIGDRARQLDRFVRRALTVQGTNSPGPA